MIDLRNVYSRDEVSRHGFDYVSVGRPIGETGGVMSAAAE